MSLISKPETKKPFKVHIAKNGRPLCGGGRLARLVAQWQSDIGPANCLRCLSIQERSHEKTEPTVAH